ncbi:MAG: serine acetyltransferase [Burkholderia sp.]
MAAFDIEGIVQSLHAVRHGWRQRQQRLIEPGVRHLPSREALRQIVEKLKGVLFPMWLGPPDLRQESEDLYVAHALDAVLNELFAQARLKLRYAARYRDGGEATEIAARLPEICGLLDEDVLAAYHGDPAVGSVDEVLLCYPGILAIIHYRIAHELYRLGLPLLARMLAEHAHADTGVDIHPGTRIGAGFFIDHGTGVVIGETAIIGERVRIYQAVTLGAKRFPRDAAGHLEKGLARHLIVEDDVVIYAGATLLGGITIGCDAVIGGNVWLHDVPPGSHVTQAVPSSEVSQPAAQAAARSAAGSAALAADAKGVIA